MTKTGYMLFGATLVLCGCELIDDTTGGTTGPCTADYDCAVGSVCTISDGQTEGACEPAAEGQTRTFGQASVEVDSTDDVFLVSVLALPTGATASSGIVSFTLDAGGGSTAGTSSATLRQVRSSASIDRDRWDARLAFDRRQRQGLNQLVEDINAGRRSVYPRARLKNAGCDTCPSNQMCWQGACSSEVTANFAGTPVTLDVLRAVTTDGHTINILVDQSSVAQGNAAQAAVEAFASTLSTELGILGVSSHEGAADRDEDGRLTVAFTDKQTENVTTDIVGFFDYRDFLPTSDAEATGNEADLLWARLPNDQSLSQAAVVAVLAHEYTHLASFAQRVYANASQDMARQEVLWLDEGLAHLMEDLVGWGASNVESVSQALDNWNDTTLASGNDTIEQRGMSYLLLRHIVDQRAAAAGANDAGSTKVLEEAQAMYTSLIAGEAKGLEHQMFQSRTAADWSQWLLAVYATGNSDVIEAAHAYDYLSLATHSTSGQLQGMDPRGEDYVDGSGESLSLEGPSTEDLDSAPLAFESDVSESGSVLYELTGVDTGTLVITGQGDATVNLQIAVEKVQ